MSIVQSKALKYIIIVLSSIVLGWLVNEFIWPGTKKPFIGTCENTDVGVTAGNPKAYMLNSGMMMEQSYTVSGFAASNLLLVDSFSYQTTRIIVRKRDGRCCYDYFSAVKREDPRVEIQYYSVSESQYVVMLDHGYWKVLRPKAGSIN